MHNLFIFNKNLPISLSIKFDHMKIISNLQILNKIKKNSQNQFHDTSNYGIQSRKRYVSSISEAIIFPYLQSILNRYLNQSSEITDRDRNQLRV